jgi:hypothetical protein
MKKEEEYDRRTGRRNEGTWEAVQFLNGVGLTLIGAFHFNRTSNILLHTICKLCHLLFTAVNNISSISQLLRSAQALPTDWTVRHEQSTCLSSETPIQALRPTKPPAQRTPTALSPELTWQGHEADQPLPTTAQVTNEWSYASAPPYAFMTWSLPLLLLILLAV